MQVQVMAGHPNERVGPDLNQLLLVLLINNSSEAKSVMETELLPWRWAYGSRHLDVLCRCTS